MMPSANDQASTNLPGDGIRESGAVLGIDVGFSPQERTTSYCLMQWTDKSIEITFDIIGVNADERRRRLRALLGSKRTLDGVAIDGPLTKGLRRITHYRAAEAMLSRGVLQCRGKPGQTSSPTGLMLHQHATEFANLVLAEALIAPASHHDAIHRQSVVEAFPNMFLAALIPEASLPSLNRDASDRYWEVAVQRTQILENLVGLLLPGRRLTYTFQSCTDHDHRAGVVCALTALSVVAALHVGVGDPDDGDIILPPRTMWGASRDSADPWMEAALRQNVRRVRSNRKNHSNHSAARAVQTSGVWFQ